MENCSFLSLSTQKKSYIIVSRWRERKKNKYLFCHDIILIFFCWVISEKFGIIKEQNSISSKEWQSFSAQSYSLFSLNVLLKMRKDSDEWMDLLLPVIPLIPLNSSQFTDESFLFYSKMVLCSRQYDRHIQLWESFPSKHLATKEADGEKVESKMKAYFNLNYLLTFHRNFKTARD